jgi:hypothetical protein
VERGSLEVFNLRTGVRHMIRANRASDHGGVAWSTDERRIAVPDEVSDSGDGASDIFLVPARGGRPST